MKKNFIVEPLPNPIGDAIGEYGKKKLLNLAKRHGYQNEFKVVCNFCETLKKSICY